MQELGIERSHALAAWAPWDMGVSNAANERIPQLPGSTEIRRSDSKDVKLKARSFDHRSLPHPLPCAHGRGDTSYQLRLSEDARRTRTHGGKEGG